MPPLGIAPRLSAPQAEVLLLYYSGALWRCRASIPDLNLAKVVCYHLQHTPAACVRRDSNPNLMLGRHKYYPCTTDAWPPCPLVRRPPKGARARPKN